VVERRGLGQGRRAPRRRARLSDAPELSARRLILATAAALLVAAAPAGAAPQLAVGIADDAALQYERDPFRAARTVAAWREAGVDTVRIVAEWQKVSPEVPAQRAPAGFDVADHTAEGYGWERLDRAVGLARGAGLRIVLVVTGPAPVWATADPARGSTRYRPRADLFARFARAVATRFGAAVDRYVIWNEPNLPLWLQPQSACPAKIAGRPRPRCSSVAAHLYRELYRAADPAIRAADPGSRVWFGALAPRGERPLSRNAKTRPLAFLRALACRDERLARVRTGPCRSFRPLRSDGLAYHPHGVRLAPDEPSPQPDDAALADLPRLEALLDALQRLGGLRRRGDGGVPRPLPLHLTEFGFETSPPDLLRGVSPAVQARHLQQAAYVAWRDPRVKTLIQYEWRDEPLGRDNPFAPAYSGWQSGLRYADDRPKPALAAFRLPFWIDQPPGSPTARFWGQVRSGTAHRVTLQRRGGPGRPWARVLALPTDARGYWSMRRPVPATAQYRYAVLATREVSAPLTVLAAPGSAPACAGPPARPCRRSARPPGTR
jgi:hypothetical protein